MLSSSATADDRSCMRHPDPTYILICAHNEGNFSVSQARQHLLKSGLGIRPPLWISGIHHKENALRFFQIMSPAAALTPDVPHQYPFAPIIRKIGNVETQRGRDRSGILEP